jgi:hypothetical protein
MSLTGDALYTPLVEESMLPFWYLVGSAIVQCLVELSLCVKTFKLNGRVCMQARFGKHHCGVARVVIEGSSRCCPTHTRRPATALAAITMRHFLGLGI